MLAGICVYIGNWSIIRRTCNPYARHPDLWEYILEVLHYGSSSLTGTDDMSGIVEAAEEAGDLIAAQFQTAY